MLVHAAVKEVSAAHMCVSFVRWPSRDNYLEPLSVYIAWIIQTAPSTSVTAMEHVNQTNKRVQGHETMAPSAPFHSPAVQEDHTDPGKGTVG